MSPLQRKFEPLFSLAFFFLAALLVGALTARAQAPPAPNPSPFGPNVYVITPTMSTSAINSLLNSLNKEAQFSTNRYAVLFQPGVYGSTSSPVGAQVGYYEQISGLGALPTGVAITGGMGVDQLVGTAPTADMTQNFWRSMENFTERAASGATGILDWGVSQGASLRRMNVQSNLWFANSGPINGENACQQSSGGFMADSVVTGQVNACSQQQWYTRNSNLPGGFSGNVWNFVFSGVSGAPNPSYPGGAAGDTNVTVVPTTPVSREKPFLHVDTGGNYRVFVPSALQNSSGISWASGQTPGFDAPIGAFYIATPSSSITDINNALAGGTSLILTPGIYKYNDPIHITRSGTVVLGMGYATIVPQNGNPGMIVDDVDNVQIAGLLFDAGPTNSAVLLQVGQPGIINNNHANNPTSISDVFFRIGGGTVGTVNTALQVDSGNVILDNIWAWRADHGNPGTFGWTVNTANHGVVVNGTYVEALGLAVEHFQQEQTLWNGEGGKTIFYQSELPYDPPNQAAWSKGPQNGYPSYNVTASGGCSHQAWGLGIYSFFNQGANIVEDNAISVPNTVGTSITDAGTVFLNGSGSITHVVNTAGASASSANTAKLVPVTQFSGSVACQDNQLALPVGSVVPLGTISNPNPNNLDAVNVMNALYLPPSDLVLLSAHRGLHALAGLNQAKFVSENSLVSIGEAAQAGWEMIELDIKLTSDGTPILSHDKTWGREWCGVSGNNQFDPFTGAYPAANPRVDQTLLKDTRSLFGSTVLRDSVSLTSGYYSYGCSDWHQLYSGEYPPRLEDAYNFIRRNHIHMLISLDVQGIDIAKAAWAVVNAPQNLDDQKRPFYQSTVFKMPATLVRNGYSDITAIFQGDTAKVNFVPVFTTAAIAPIGGVQTDTEDAGFDIADIAPGFGTEQAVIGWLQQLELSPLHIPTVEVGLKEQNGILTDLLSAARTNYSTKKPMGIGQFNPVGEYYHLNGDSSNKPYFFRSSDGTCCDILDKYLYNNPNHIQDSNPGAAPIPGGRYDNQDLRTDLQNFIIPTNNQRVTTDDPQTLANLLSSSDPAKNKRNICYLQQGYTGGACGAGTTSSKGPAAGRYTLLNVNSGLAMDVSGNSTTAGAGIDQWPSNYGLNQQWQVTAVGGGIYTLAAYNDGLCLDVYQGSTQSGATLDQYTCNANANNQQFTIAAANDGNYTIVGRQSGLAVEVPNSSVTAGAALDQATLNGGKNQEWQLVSPGPAPGTYKIVNQNSGLAMEVSGNSTATGAAVDQWTSNNGTNQQWKITTQSNGTYQIANANSSLCLDVPGQSTTAGTSLDQWTCNNGTNQQFKIASGPGGTYTISVAALAVEIPKASTATGTVVDQWTVNGGTNQQWVFTKLN